MSQHRDSFGIQGFGLVFQAITRSNATAPFLILTSITAIFSVLTSIYWLTAIVILGVLIIFAIAFIVDDSKLRDNQHNLAIRKMAQLGHKGAEDGRVIDGEVVQPIIEDRVQKHLHAEARKTNQTRMRTEKIKTHI